MIHPTDATADTLALVGLLLLDVLDEPEMTAAAWERAARELTDQQIRELASALLGRVEAIEPHVPPTRPDLRAELVPIRERLEVLAAA